MKMLAWSRWHSACLVFALMVARTYGKQTAKHVIFVAIDGFQLEPHEMTKGKTWSTFQQNGAYNLASNRPSWQAAVSGNDFGFRNMFERATEFEDDMRRSHKPSGLDRLGKDFTSALLTSWPPLIDMLRANEEVKCPPYTTDNPPACHVVDDWRVIGNCEKDCSDTSSDRLRNACRFCTDDADQQIIDMAIKMVPEADTFDSPNLLLVHLRGPMVAAMANGWGSVEHKLILRETETLVGKLLDALKREMRLGDTLLMVVSVAPTTDSNPAPPPRPDNPPDWGLGSLGLGMDPPRGPGEFLSNPHVPPRGVTSRALAYVPHRGPWLAQGSTIASASHMLTDKKVGKASSSIALCSLGVPSNMRSSLGAQLYGAGARPCKFKRDSEGPDTMTHLSAEEKAKTLEHLAKLQAAAQDKAKAKARAAAEERMRNSLKSWETTPAAEDCFKAMTKYDPVDDIPGEGRTTMTATQCQTRCTTVAACAYFSRWNDGGCHLSSSHANPVDDFEAVSGPRSCGPLPVTNYLSSYLSSMGFQEALRITFAFSFALGFGLILGGVIVAVIMHRCQQANNNHAYQKVSTTPEEADAYAVTVKETVET